MLNDLADSSIRISLRINLDNEGHVKPKSVAIREAVLEVVLKYVYLR
jgi:hypothetical protein